MRDIKFRAWDKIDKRLIIDKQDFIPLVVTNKGVFKLDPTCEYDRWIEIDKNRFDFMQYTGLKDKNGVEIYEGDIAKVLVAYTDYDGCEYKRPSRVYNHKTKYVNIAVSFESGTFILDTDYTDSIGNTLWLWTQEDVEVIGNIYEDSHLLDNN